MGFYLSPSEGGVGEASIRAIQLVNKKIKE